MRVGVSMVAVLVVLVVSIAVSGQQMHRNPFESRTPVWQKGPADANYEEKLHEMTGQTFHSGQQSEHIQLITEEGSYLYYTYPIGRADLLDELTVSVWLKANRPGIQFLARLVLPKERDPRNLDQPLTVMLRGDVYQKVGRWDRLEIRGAGKLAQQQQQLMRFEQKRDVNFDGAYIDQLVLNVYGGRGATELWIDDLEIGPLLGDQFQPVRPQRTADSLPEVPVPASPVATQPQRSAIISLSQDRLMVNRRPFFVRGIRHSDTPLKTLRDAGFNTLWIEGAAKEELLEEAANMGFWLAPEIPVMENNPRVATLTSLQREVTRHPANDAILFWHVGSGLNAENAARVSKAAQTIRSADPYQGRPVAGDIWDGFKPYSRNLEMLGMHRWPLNTGLELAQYREWLVQRSRLAEPGTYTWTWIQTHLPEWYTGLVYQHTANEEFDEPIGPQPEQIRLLTYLALSAGYRGIGFWSDRFLANTHHGRDRLLQLALLNQELEMLEEMLATTKDIGWIDTKHSEVKAAVMRYDGGVLVIPIWMGSGAQYVPGQLAVNNLELTVPGAPMDAQVWEVSPGDVRALKATREAGGLKVIIPEFGLTTALVFTSDVNAQDGGTVGRLQQAARRTRKLAAQWSYDLAVEELAKVERVNARLEQMRMTQPDAQPLLAECRRRLAVAREAWQRDTQSDYRIAYGEAQRALRPLRILMRAHWEQASKPLDAPVASPYAVSFFTLPQHWQMAEDIRNTQAAGNLLANGDFELTPDQVAENWIPQEVTLDPVQLSARRIQENAHQGKQCLKLEVKPSNPRSAPAALERTFLAISTPTITLQPNSIVRVSGWVRIPDPIRASADGVLFYDSIGGEQLAVRLTGATPWRKFTLYRRVPSNGEINVTMALTGIGAAYFDDIRIEPLYPRTAGIPPTSTVAGSANGSR